MTIKNAFEFFSRGEKRILGKVLLNLDISIDATRHLLALTNAIQKHDYDSANVEYDKISELEWNADKEHRSLVREICTRSFFGGIREDLLNLLEFIDNIIDDTKDAAEIFHERRIPEEVIDYLFKDDVKEFISACLEATELLKESIKALEKDRNEVLSLVEKVEKSETRADEIRYRILGNLLKNEINANVLDVIMLKDFLNVADNIANDSEDASDVLQILVAKGYS